MKRLLSAFFALCFLSFSLLPVQAAEKQSEQEKGAVKIMEQLQEYAGKDFDTFKTLFYQADEDLVMEYYEQDYSYVSAAHKTTKLLATSGKTSVVNIIYYQGDSPDAVQFAPITVTMVKKGKKYLIDHRSSTVRRLNKDLAKKIELPSGYLNATKNLVNLDEYNYMPFFEDFYMEDYIYAEPNLLWQEENGDVVAEIWINNGLDQDQHYTKGQLICQDDSLGEIIHFTTDVDVQVKKNSSATTTITIPADQVKSGDQSWTYINASVALVSE